MGISVSAFIVVGLTAAELDITEAPFYDEFMAYDGYGDDERGFGSLFDFYYLIKNKLSGNERELRAIRTHIDNTEPDEEIVGFVAVDSSDWTAKEIDLDHVRLQVGIARGKFIDIFHKIPKVYLMPRYW